MQMLAAKHGFGEMGHGAGRDVPTFGFKGSRDPDARLDALRSELAVTPVFGTARYERISGRCGTPRFDSDFRIDVGGGEERPIRFVQSFAGGEFENVSILRSKRLGMFSDQSRRFDEVYFFGEPQDGIKQGIVMNGQDRSFRNLRDVDVFGDALDRRFIGREVQAAVSDMERPRALQTALGAPNNACTMRVTLTPDADSRQFDEGRPRGPLRFFIDALDQVGGAGQVEGEPGVTDRADDPGSAVSTGFDTWQDSVPGTPGATGRFVLDSGLDGLKRQTAIDGMDAFIIDTGIRGEVNGFVSDRAGDVVECDTGEVAAGRDGADIVGGASLAAPDGSTTTMVRLTGDPLATSMSSWSWAVSGTYLMPGGQQRQWIAEVHDGSDRFGRVRQNGEIANSSSGNVSVTEDGVIFNEPNGMVPMAIFVQGFNTPVEGQGRSCDSSVIVPFPSTFPMADAPKADAAFSCAPSDTAACLNNERFQAEVFDASGSMPASVSAIDPTASFHMIGDDPNQRALIRVVDACGLNGHYWVGYADSGVDGHSARVIDVQTGSEWSHTRAANGGPTDEWHIQALPCE